MQISNLPIRSREVFLVVLGSLAVFWQPGLFLNDEILQGLGLYSMTQGRLWIHSGLPEGYYGIRWDAHFWHPSFPEPGTPPIAPVGSTLLNVLALTPRLVLGAVAWLIGPFLAQALVAILLVTLGLRTVLARLFHNRPDNWVNRRANGAAAFLGVGAIVVDPGIPASPFLEFGALQLVSMIAMAGSAVLVFALLRTHVDQSSSMLVTTIFVLGTPALFWALNTKYHALAVLLVLISQWSLKDGRGTTWAGAFTAFAAAGLATWNQPPLGLVLTVACLVFLIPALIRSARVALRLVAASAGGFLAGVGPGLIESRAAAAAGFAPVVQTYVTSPQSHAQGSVLTDPGPTLQAAFETLIWTWGSRPDPPALSFLCLLPLVALASATLLRRSLRTKLPHALWTWPVVYGGILFASFGERILWTGAGWDVRHAVTLWAPLMVLAAPALAERSPLLMRTSYRVGLWVVAALCVVVSTNILQNYVIAGVRFDAIYGGSLVWLSRYAGLALGAFLGVAAVLAVTTPRLGSKWLDVLVPPAIAAGVQVQVLLQLAEARPVHPATTAPFLIWPTELVGRFVDWAVLMA